MLTLMDDMTAAFLAAIQAGGQALAVFMLPILSVCALISYYREYSATVMSSGAGMGDALAHGMLLIFAAGCYLFLLTQIFTIAQAALDLMFTWGLLGAGGRRHLGATPDPVVYFPHGAQSGEKDCGF